MSVDLNAAAWRSQRWAARTSLAAAALAVLLPLGYGGLGGVLLLAAGLAGAAGTAAAVWWTLTRRGPERWLAAGLAVVTPALVLVLFVVTLGWVLVLAPVLWSVAVWSGRYALRSTGTRPKRMKEHRARSVRQPVLIMNPRSGGGKVEQFRLRERAEHLGARVVLLDPEGYQDVTALARAAVAEGADLLGVAGGDGTQALVAAVAAAHDLPFLVVCAGTRNHFAMDLGLDRTDPATCLDALTDGVELRVDLGFVADHPFVNNASFGAYAAVVQSPAYRDDKIGTTLELLPDLLTRQRGPHLIARIEATTIDGPQALLVSNNAYRTGDPVGLGRRERLDSGLLGILGVRVDSAAEAAALLLDPAPEGLAVLSAREVVVDADHPVMEVGGVGVARGRPAPGERRHATRALTV
ncbi:diacylglycerol kinase family protein, partial [Streptomyces sp. NPDC097941]|uniref:diacylglycerol/lipid kinase family protein n=1 Tax=Streptomyces sp. NPDC097941 TaxID=3155685 RepID=UPI0033336861